MRGWKRWIWTGWLVGMIALQVDAQCRIDTLIEIETTDTVVWEIEVRGVLRNDLSLPDQGLCAVELAFEHEYVGDLLVWLTSPAGQTVQLLGPEVMSGVTFFQEWDVCFVRDVDNAVPDPGFSARWSNNQNWGVGGGKVYTGSYYPFGGKLEDFNTGPVNGVWTLRIEDRQRFYEGAIKGVRLVFCDDVGAACNPCSPPAILPVGTRLVVYCYTGDSVVLRPEFTPFANDTLYKYYNDTFILIDNGKIVELGREFKFLPRRDGIYTICGMTYYRPHRKYIPDTGLTWTEFVSEFVDSNKACGYLGTKCKHYVWMGAIDDTIVDAFCRGEEYRWRDTVLTQPGIYRRAFKSRWGCDSTVTLILREVDMQLKAHPVDTLDCATPEVPVTVSLQIDSTDPRITTRWQWNARTGRIQRIEDDSIAHVDRGGVVVARVEYGQCVDSIAIEVVEDTSVLRLSISDPPAIDCNNPLSCFFLSTSHRFRSLHLYKGGLKGTVYSSDSMQARVCLFEAGQYTVVAEDIRGCVAQRVIEVRVDTTVPNPVIEWEALECGRDSTALVLKNPEDYVDFTWTTIFLEELSKDTVLVVHEEGTYVLTVKAANGCTVDAVVTISDNRKSYDPHFILDTLTCAQQSFRLQHSLDPGGGSFWWTAPDGTMTRAIYPLIEQPGKWQLHFEDTLGCTLDTVFEVPIDTALPRLKFIGAFLSCSKPSVHVSIEGDTTGLRFQWTGPDSFYSEEATPELTKTGKYKVVYSAPNGCMRTEWLWIGGDINFPQLVIEPDTPALDCRSDSVLLQAAVTNRQDVEIYWLSASGWIRSTSVWADQPGWYIARVITSDSCQVIDSVYVQVDTTAPQPRIKQGGPIDCRNPVSAWSVAPDCCVDSVYWYLNGRLLSTSSSVEVQEGGQLELVVVGRNGCTSVFRYEIEADLTKPAFSLQAEDISCSNPTATLHWSGDSSEWARWYWSDADGHQLGQDSVTVDDGGVYYFTVHDRNGCIHTDSVEVRIDTMPPIITLAADTLTCARPVGYVVATGDYDTGYWNVANDFIPNDSLQVSVPGRYTFVAERTNGCRDSAFVEVKVDTTKPEWRIVSLQSLDCGVDTGFIHIQVDTQYIAVRWESLDGGKLNSTEHTRVFTTDAGRYLLVLLNRRNGCVASDTLAIEDNREQIEVDEVAIVQPSCSGPDAGVVRVALPDTVVGRYRYFINGSPSTHPEWDGLEPGSYRIAIETPRGCRWDTLIRIEALPTVEVRIVGDSVVNEGDSLLLMADVRIGGTDSIDRYAWSPSEWMGCDTCARTFVGVTESGWVRLIVYTQSGCRGVDSLWVRLKKVLRYFIPNAFSPNGDGWNDTWNIYVDARAIELVEIDIYTRWGEHILHKTVEVQQTNEIFLWDGQMKDRPAPPGVYVGRIKLRERDGKVHLFVQSVTLLR